MVKYPVSINKRIYNKLLIFNLFRYNIDITRGTIKLFAALQIQHIKDTLSVHKETTRDKNETGGNSFKVGGSLNPSD